jgi:putative transposase
MDCYSRRIVGWPLADHLRAELVVDALEMAVTSRPSPAVDRLTARPTVATTG